MQRRGGDWMVQGVIGLSKHLLEWCIKNIFDTTEEIEDVDLQNFSECARGFQKYDQVGIHARL